MSTRPFLTQSRREVQQPRATLWRARRAPGLSPGRSWCPPRGCLPSGRGKARPCQHRVVTGTSHPRGVLGSCYLVRWGEPGGAVPALPEPGAQCTDSHFFINS